MPIVTGEFPTYNSPKTFTSTVGWAVAGSAADVTLRRLAAGALARAEVIPANANYGAFSIGSGPFDGTTAGFFTGSASGTGLAINAASGFAGNLFHFQVAGVDVYKGSAAGLFIIRSSTPQIRWNQSGTELGIISIANRVAATDFEIAPMGSNNLVFSTNASTTARIVIDSSGVTTMRTCRFEQAEGASVASATQVTLGTDGNVFHITGTTQTDLILNTNWQGGSKVTLIFDGIVTVRHNQAASGNFKPLMLNGAVSFVTAADNTLTLVYDSTNSKWYEISRKV